MEDPCGHDPSKEEAVASHADGKVALALESTIDKKGHVSSLESLHGSHAAEESIALENPKVTDLPPAKADEDSRELTARCAPDDCLPEPPPKTAKTDV